VDEWIVFRSGCFFSGLDGLIDSPEKNTIVGEFGKLIKYVI
jgi:hypothetical protein